ncbi:MAG: Hsp70 family protein [Bacillota bacterium]
MNNKTYNVGIDLGNENSSVAITVGEHARIVAEDKSVAYYSHNKGTLIFGNESLEIANAERNQKSVIKYFKSDIRKISNLELNNKEVFNSNGKTFSINEVVIGFAKYALDIAIKKMKEMHFVDEATGYSDIELTISTPAGLGSENSRNSASEYNKYILKGISEATGIAMERIHIIEEPKAAAFAYVKDSLVMGNQIVLVLDVGAGTTDVAIVERSGDRINVIKCYGDIAIGGRNFDTILQNMAKSKGGISKNATLEEISRFEDDIHRAKHILSNEQFATIPKGDDDFLTISRTQFESESSAELKKIEAVVDSCMKEYSGRIDKIVLVGGASAMPMVRNMMIRKFKSRVSESNIVAFKPSEAIALGNAYYSYFKTNYVSSKISDVIQHSYGVLCRSDEGPYISNIIIKGSPIDNLCGGVEVKSDGKFIPYEKKQEVVTIEVFENDSTKQVVPVEYAKMHGSKCTIDVPKKYYKAWFGEKSHKFAFDITLKMHNSTIDITLHDKKGNRIPHREESQTHAM